LIKWEGRKAEQELTSSDDDVGVEVVTVRHGKGDREVPTLCILDVICRKLLLPRSFPVRVLAIIILRVDDDASLVVAKVGDNVAPPLVVMDANGNDEVLAGVGHETMGAACSTSTHAWHMLSVRLSPGSAAGIVPNGLLDNVEVGRGWFGRYGGRFCSSFCTGHFEWHGVGGQTT
jgi:hypothetical protein